FAASLLTDWFVRDVVRDHWQHQVGYWWAVPGPLVWAYLGLYAAENVGVYFALLRAQRRTAGARRAQLRLMLLAVIFLLVAGSNDLMHILGMEHYPFTSHTFVPFANLAAIFYALVVAYSLLQHQFLDVHVSLSRAA